MALPKKAPARALVMLHAWDVEEDMLTHSPTATLLVLYQDHTQTVPVQLLHIPTGNFQHASSGSVQDSSFEGMYVRFQHNFLHVRFQDANFQGIHSYNLAPVRSQAAV
mmetsp:Transcript_104603/g.207718  ORF Transcript_104603/g.207718 Transcript_104603/m.207718 type:complete len:108 (+) Transcript_104603:204-527(+)